MKRKDMNELIKIEGHAGISSTGWELSNLTESQWADAGNILVKIDQARQWWLGDWWNACQWGDGRAACESLGINYQTAVNCGNVAANFEFNRRRLDLSFTHHAEVCPVDDPEMQDRLLDWAEKEDVTVKGLRAKVQAYLAMADWSETEKARRFEAEAGKTVVANINQDADVNLVNWAKSEGLYKFIGRGQYDLGWGNPYALDEDGDREQVCDAHREYFKFKRSLHKKVSTLKGKVLGCYCYPARCHGDYLAEIANGNLVG